MPERFEPRVRRRRQRPAPPDHVAPGPVRVGGAVLRRAPRALRRQLPDVAVAGAGARAAGRHGPRGVRREGRRPACGAAGGRVDVVGAGEQLGKRIRAAKLEKLPYILVVGDDDVAAGTVGVNRRGSERPERGVDLATIAAVDWHYSDRLLARIIHESS